MRQAHTYSNKTFNVTVSQKVYFVASYKNKKALSPFFGKLSYDHTDFLRPIFYRFFGLNPSKTNLKLPNFKLLEK